MTTKKIWMTLVGIISALLIAYIFYAISTPCYDADNYKLKVLSSFQISSENDNLLIYQSEKIVGGITYYADNISYDSLMELLKNGKQWDSYSLESDGFADKRLSFVNADGEFHHYIYHAQDKGVYDLWFCSSLLSENDESWIVEHFQMK